MSGWVVHTHVDYRRVAGFDRRHACLIDAREFTRPSDFEAPAHDRPGLTVDCMKLPLVCGEVI